MHTVEAIARFVWRVEQRGAFPKRLYLSQADVDRVLAELGAYLVRTPDRIILHRTFWGVPFVVDTHLPPGVRVIERYTP